MAKFEVKAISKEKRNILETQSRRVADPPEYFDEDFLRELNSARLEDSPVFRVNDKWWEFKISGNRVEYWQLNKHTPCGNFSVERLHRL